MERVLEWMEERQAELEEMIRRKELALKQAPPGMLRVGQSSSRVQYYHRLESGDPCGKYIRKKDRGLATALAQKEYDHLVSEAAARELEALNQMKEIYPGRLPEQVYDELLPSKRPLVMPDVLSDRLFAKQWEQFPYAGKPFQENVPELYTKRGERVRSKSEVIIANALAGRETIPYRYECPLTMADGSVWYPDFTILNVRLRKVYYWEHFGMMDNEEYSRNAAGKILRYQANGIYPGDPLIMTFETARRPLNLRIVESMIDHYLM